MKDQLRVRFAPSPTGFLHVGGLRTALFNYLIARKNDGVFVLRVEDTDRSRYVEGAVERLIDTLRWAGLTYDEGPGKGGACGPYELSSTVQKPFNCSMKGKHTDAFAPPSASTPCEKTLKGGE